MFIDTSGFLCRYEKREIFHEKAVKLYDPAALCITTNYVLAEYTALAEVRGLPREQIIEFSEDILAAEKVEIVWVDEKLHREGVRLLRERNDKAYSLCDAVALVFNARPGFYSFAQMSVVDFAVLGFDPANSSTT